MFSSSESIYRAGLWCVCSLLLLTPVMVEAQNEPPDPDPQYQSANADMLVCIVDESGVSVADASAVIGNMLAISDTNGVCVFPAMEPGTYTVSVSARGYIDSPSNCFQHAEERTAGTNPIIKLSAAPTTLFVKIVDEGGLPMNNIPVTIGSATVPSDISGVARFENIILNNHVPFAIRKTGFVPIDEKIRLPAENWSKETSKIVIMYRMEQFHISMLYNIEDPVELAPNNGDGKANAGEAIRLAIVVSNMSSEATAAWMFTAECDSPLLKMDKQVIPALPPLKPGEKKKFLLPAKVDLNIGDLAVARISASVTPTNDALGKIAADLPLPIQAGEPLNLKLLLDPVLYDPDKGPFINRNNGNNVIGPGEHGFLKLTIGNTGGTVKDTTFNLQTIPPTLIPQGAIKNAFKPGFEFKQNQMLDPTFEIDLPIDYNGAVLPLEFLAKSHGRTWETQFTIPVEGREDFHASLEISGKFIKGSICNYILKLVYSGNYLENRAIINLHPSREIVRINPTSFYKHVITPGKAEEFKGMISIPPDFDSSSLVIFLEVLDKGRENIRLFKKDFTCQIEKSE